MCSKNGKKTVVVTGGAGGIGSAVCRRFAAAGYNVMIHYFKSEKAALDLKSELCRGGTAAECFSADLRDPAEAKRLISKTLFEFGDVDVLVNNAGVSHTALFTDTSEDDYERIFDTNVKSAVFASKAAVFEMLKKQSGSIINVSSVFGVTGGSCEVLYSASKSALIGFTKALSKELSFSGIGVFCVAPGVVDTAMFSCYDDKTRAEIISEIPLGYPESPENIAESVYFLSTDAGRYYSGQVLCPSGGFGI